MIITRTPLRVSFAGGGTDLPSFYKDECGAVVSTAIDKYIYVCVHKPFYNEIHLKYSKTERVQDIYQIEHPIIREALRLTGIRKQIEIAVSADIPAGTGLGTSSSFTVGLLQALYAYRGINVSAERLAREAVMIEIEILKSPIGKQDQYAAAYGGFNQIIFNKDDSVHVRPILFDKKEELQRNLLLFHTGTTRSANVILADQSRITPVTDSQRFETMRRMRAQTVAIVQMLEQGDIAGVGRIMHEGWLLKRSLVSSISNSMIDEIYERALIAGAGGGKIVGAGGGGFLLLYVEPSSQDKVRLALSDLQEVPIRFDPVGSTIVYVED
jgi:D-glycero-alpha-D-manno-heptose-7-phosphate kinase